ncbi:transferase [Syncephalis fuscata]|nr:transferase [Syncephalis fuscata]
MIVSSNEIWLSPNSDHAKQIYRLNHADHFPIPMYPHQFFFYKNHDHASDFMPTDRLIQGLKKTLLNYPILYGHLKLRDDGEFEVQPSTKGVLFTEAFSGDDISIFEPDWPQHTITNDLQAIQGPQSEKQPILGVKVTRYANNSGVAVSVACHHYVADGLASMLFIKDWAAFVRGKNPPLPTGDRRLLMLDPKPTELQQQEERRKRSALCTSISKKSAKEGIIFQFTPENLAALKEDAIESLTAEERNKYWLSTMDAVVALSLRAITRARKISADQPLIEQAAINMRSCFPGIPDNYFGNALYHSKIFITAGEMTRCSLGSLAIKNRQAILVAKSSTKEQWLSEAEITGQATLTERLANWDPYADYAITDWSKFGYYEIDFGYGIPTRCRCFMSSAVALVCILDMPPFQNSQRGFEVCISIDKNCYERLIHDEELANYSRVIG